MIHKSYHGGKVQSLWFETADGPASVGVISPGTYAFTTETREYVVVLDGILEVSIADGDWRRIEPHGSYDIRANVKFEVHAEHEVAYLCCFLRERS